MIQSQSGYDHHIHASDGGEDPFSEYGASRPVSGLALASLVLSLIACLPFVPLVGAILGVAAIVQITTRGDRSGIPLAVAGIAIGSLVTLIFFGGIYVVYQRELERFAYAERAIQAIQANDSAQLVDTFTGANADSLKNDADRFLSELQKRYGNLVEFTLQSESQAPAGEQAFAQHYFNYILQFERARIEAVFGMRDLFDHGLGREVRVMQMIFIPDPEHGALRFPMEP